MSIAPSIESLADKASEKLRASSDKSREKFFRVLNEVIRGAGIGQQNERSYRIRLQSELSRRSALHRSVQAAARRKLKEAS